MSTIKKTGIPEIDAFVSQARKDAYAALKEATKILADGYKDAVRDFYKSYSPSSYDRTFSTFEATDSYGSSLPKVTYIGNNTFEGGIVVDPSFIPGDPYKAHRFRNFMSTAKFSKEIIFSATYFMGSHGWVSYSTPPSSLMKKTFKRAQDYVEKRFFNKYA